MPQHSSPLGDETQPQPQLQTDERFGTLANARDLAGSAQTSGIRPGTLFRSAAPTEQDDVKMQLRTVIDLRSTFELKREPGGHALENVPGCTVLCKDGLSDPMMSELKAAVKSQPGCFLCNLCCFKLTCQEAKLMQASLPVMMDAEVMADGYKAILTEAGEVVCELLELCADRNNHPLLFHCSAGRDRTGMLSMLIQHIAGCPREYIVADYAASTDLLLSSNLLHRKYAELLPADEAARAEYIDLVCRCHPSAMEETLNFVDETWGGLDQYLDSVGFDSQRREAMRAAIVGPPDAELE